MMEPEGITEGIAEGIKTFPERISNVCNPFIENDMQGGENRTEGAIPVAQSAQLNRTQFSPAEEIKAPALRRFSTTQISFNSNPNPNCTPEPEAIPENFKPDASNKRYAKKQGLDLEEERVAFSELHGSIGNLRQNWQKVFRKWLIDAAPLRGHVVDLPDWMPMKEWREYLAMRERNRCGTTKRGEELTVEALAKLHEQGYSVKALLDRCVANNWIDPRRAASGMTTGSLRSNVCAQFQGTPTFDAVAVFRAST